MSMNSADVNGWVHLRKQPTFRDTTRWKLREMTSDQEASTEIPYWWRITTQIWVVLLIS